MLDWGMTVLCGMGCAAAIVFAAHSPRDGRWEAVSLSCMLLINWALFILAYTDWSPHVALAHVGVDVSSVHLWMLADAIGGGSAIAIAHRFWWGWALWMIAVAQISFHVGMDFTIFDPVSYTDMLLNLALLVQLAIFFVVGGRGVGDILLRGVDRLRLSCRQAGASHSQRTRR